MIVGPLILGAVTSTLQKSAKTILIKRPQISHFFGGRKHVSDHNN